MRENETAAEAGNDPENPHALPPLERQVVDLLMAGLTGGEVGDLLGIDRRGVALRRASVMRKYGARNSMHLAHLIDVGRARVDAEASRETETVVVIEDVPTALTY